MTCQPNVYGGLIKEEEWDGLRNVSLKKLLINSISLSLDMIDYLRTTCQKLEHLIMDPEKFKYFCQNLVGYNPKASQVLDPDDRLMVYSTAGNRVLLSRRFKLKNLLRNKYSAPFSDSMMSVMKNYYQKEVEEDKQTCKKKID